MQPTEILIFTLPVWILTNFWLLPLFYDRWKAGDLSSQITRVGTLTVIEKVRDLSAIASVVIIGLMVLVACGSIFSNSDINASKSVIEVLSSFYESVKSFSNSYNQMLVWIGLLSAAVCLFMIGKQAKKKVSNAWIEKANEIRERISNDYNLLHNLRDIPELSTMIGRMGDIMTVLVSSEESSQDSENELNLSEQERYELESEYQYLFTTVCFELAKKEVDIEAALTSNIEDENQIDRSKRNRIFNILMSKRFAKDLGLVSRPMSFLVTALLLVSLTGWASSPLSNSLQLTVNNLRIQALDNAVDRELEAAISKIENADDEVNDEIDSNTINANVIHVSRALAQVSVNQLVNSGILERSAGMSTRGMASSASKSEFVRATIIGQQFDVTSETSVAQKVRKEVSDDFLRAKSTNEMSGLVDDVERQIRPTIERISDRNPHVIARLVDKIEARYSTSMSALDAQSNLVSKMVGQAFSGLDTNIDNEIARQGQKILKDVGNKSVSTWVNSHVKSLVTEVLTDQTHSIVAAKMQQGFHFHVSNETKEFASKLQAARDTGWNPSGVELKERNISTKLANKVANNYSDDAVKAMVRQSLGGYSELFPAAADIASNAASGGGGGSNTSPDHMKARSSNFKKASRSFRVRGVLFGQELSGEELVVTDLNWKIKPKNSQRSTMVVLTLKMDGSWHEIGEFPAAVVNQGLRYAADERVVATTITPGDEEVISRVTYLHPALVDTPMGCRVIEADRFVDTFSFEQSMGFDGRLSEISKDRIALSNFLRFAAFSENVAESNSFGNQCPLGEIEDLVKQHQLGDIFITPTLDKTIQKFISDDIAEPSGGNDFLRAAYNCAIVPRSDTASCLCDSFSDMAHRYWFPEDHTSQFREKPDQLTADLAWLKKSKDSFAHIDLWLHTTFAIRERSYSSSGVADESTAMAMDFTESQLALLKKVIVGGLLEPYLKQQLYTTYDHFMRPLEDFVIIQRLIRAALNGQLSNEFPMEKLIQLELDTRSFVPHQSTMRWEAYAGKEADLMKLLNDVDSKAIEYFISADEDAYTRYKNKEPRCGDVSL